MAHTLDAQGSSGKLDADYLAQLLRVLSTSTRLRILEALETPQRIGDLRIPASGEWHRFRADRTLSRAAVLEHVSALEALGLVRRLSADGEYAVDRQAIYRIVRDLGVLAQLKPDVEVDTPHTLAAAGERTEPLPMGPKMTVVSGPEAGRAFPLPGPGPWTVGRSAEATIPVPYDPFASRLHILLKRSEDGLYWAEATPEVTNAPLLDFERLVPGEPVPMLPGSVVSVGSTRLVFKAI